MMKSSFVTTLALLVAGSVSAHQLHSYDEVQKVLEKGSRIHFVVDFAKCEANLKNISTLNYSGYIVPNEMVTNNDAGYLATSILHFTLNEPGFQDRPVYVFSRYTLTKDGKMTMTYSTMDAQSFAPLTEKHSFVCNLDEGIRIYG